MAANMIDAPKKTTSVHRSEFRSTGAAPYPWLVSVAVFDRPVLAGVLGALVIAFSAILVRLAEVSPSTAAFFRCLYALPVLAVLAWVERRRYGTRSWRDRHLAWAAGVFFAADLTFWHHAIAAVGAGLSTVLGNTQVVFVALLAWAALGERPSDRSLKAIPVVFLGVILISGVIGTGAYGDDPALGVAFGLLTGITYALFILILRRGNSDERRPAGPLFDATASAALFSAIGGIAVGDIDWAPGPESQAWLVLLALSSQVVGWLLIAGSLPRLPAAVTSILLTFQPVCSVVFAAAILGESPSLLQLGGAACILAGLVVATAGRRAPPLPEPELAG
jgi:drug/metabolite transporter (DMT)-like permease